MRLDEKRDEALALLMKGLMCHSAACVLYNIASEKPMQQDLWLLILLVPLVIFAAARRICGNFFGFLLVHIAVSGIFLLAFPGLEERVVVGGFTVLLALHSMYMRLRGDIEERCPAIVSVLLFFACFLAAGWGRRQNIMKISYYEAFLFLILFVVYKNLTTVTDFLEENECVEHLPVEQMKGMNRMLLVAFLLFFIIAMLLVPRLPFGTVVNGAGALLLMVVRQIILMILKLFQKDASQMEFFRQETEEMLPLIEAGETSALARILEQLVLAAAGLAAAAAAVYLIVRLLYRMYQRFYEHTQDTVDESEFIWEHPFERLRTAGKRKSKETFTGKGADQKIRRLFKKNIEKQFGSTRQVPEMLTPTELEMLLLEKNRKAAIQNLDEAAKNRETARQRIRLYEKARYSQHLCEKQDVLDMKQSLK